MSLNENKCYNCYLCQEHFSTDYFMNLKTKKLNSSLIRTNLMTILTHSHQGVSKKNFAIICFSNIFNILLNCLDYGLLIAVFL